MIMSVFLSILQNKRYLDLFTKNMIEKNFKIGKNVLIDFQNGEGIITLSYEKKKEKNMTFMELSMLTADGCGRYVFETTFKL